MKKGSLNTLATVLSDLLSLDTKEHLIINKSLSKNIFVFKLEEEKSNCKHSGTGLVLSA